jgi:hypothetical protein
MVVGLVVSAIAELAVFAWIWRPAMVLLPVARFSGLLWLVGIGVALPKSRRAVRH